MFKEENLEYLLTSLNKFEYSISKPTTVIYYFLLFIMYNL